MLERESISKAQRYEVNAIMRLLNVMAMEMGRGWRDLLRQIELELR